MATQPEGTTIVALTTILGIGLEGWVDCRGEHPGSHHLGAFEHAASGRG
jgi:hypothetical protein